MNIIFYCNDKCIRKNEVKEYISHEELLMISEYLRHIVMADLDKDYTIRIDRHRGVCYITARTYYGKFISNIALDMQTEGWASNKCERPDDRRNSRPPKNEDDFETWDEFCYGKGTRE